MSIFNEEQRREIQRMIDERVRAVSSPTPYEMRVAAGFRMVAPLARKAGVKTDTVRRYERGMVAATHESTYLNFEKIAEALGVSCEEYSAAVMRQVDARRNSIALAGAR